MKKRIISSIIVVGFGITLCAWGGQNTTTNTAVMDHAVAKEALVEGPEMGTIEELTLTATANGATLEGDENTEETLEANKVSSDDDSSNEEVSGDNVLIDENDLEEDDEYSNLAIAADVTNYVNIRSLPSTDGEVVGKIFHGAVAEILEEVDSEDGLWFHITSGSVDGYIKAEYFVYGSDAADRIEEFVTRTVVINADRLNVRAEADANASKIGYLDYNEKAGMLEDLGEWIKIQYTSEKTGYVSSDYVTIIEEFTYAKSIAEEQAELAAIEEQKRREAELAAEEQARQAAAQTALNATTTETTSTPESTPEASVAQTTEEVTTNAYSNAVANTSYSTNDELRTSVVNYAMQYLGNVYIHGGQSLETGTDCSGFTSLIYAVYGYSLSRTPGGQLSSAGRSISIDEAKPGDIICYSSNGGKSCTHVALYIGNGQIIHSANSRKGVIISDVFYSTIIGVKNVID